MPQAAGAIKSRDVSLSDLQTRRNSLGPPYLAKNNTKPAQGCLTHSDCCFLLPGKIVRLSSCHRSFELGGLMRSWGFRMVE